MPDDEGRMTDDEGRMTDDEGRITQLPNHPITQSPNHLITHLCHCHQHYKNINARLYIIGNRLFVKPR